MKPNPNPTIRDVARVARVSTATVSRALAGDPRVTDQTRQQILDAANSLNYKKNRAASSLRKRDFSKIGVVITDIQNPFFSSVVRGIESETVAKDFNLILGNSDEDGAQELKIIRMLLEERVAGIILAPTEADCETYALLSRSQFPVVIVDRRIQDCTFDAVHVDGYSGAAAAVAYLAGLGHRRIGFIGGLAHLSVMIERKNGYLDALRAAGLPLDETLVRSANNRPDGGFQAMQALLACDPPPSAVLVANNLMTLGGLQAIHACGLAVPEQISLVGFDDMDWAPSLNPPLSVVSQPAYEMGQAAARLLLERLEDPALPPRQILLETRLILRASCQKFES